MAEIYFRLVKSGAWSLERVPAKWRSQVENLLNQLQNDDVKESNAGDSN